METLLPQIEAYWTKRADSFSERSVGEPGNENETRWLQIILQQLPLDAGKNALDIGTGPGFFAIALARNGYDVTAVDYTQAMLEKAMENAGEFKNSICFKRMDAQCLELEDNTFDLIVTRNLTWNLEHPDLAYKEWRRVLKPGGVLLNFDAGWYEYLFDEEKAAQWQADRKNVIDSGVPDGNAYPYSYKMEEICRHLVLSRCKRPMADLQMLLDAGFSLVSVDRSIWQKTLSPEEQINYASTPGFMLKAVK